MANQYLRAKAVSELVSAPPLHCTATVNVRSLSLSHRLTATHTTQAFTDDMVNQKNDDNVPPAPPTAVCTPLERRLTSWCCFFFVLVCNALLRLFLWPYLTGSRYMVFIVVGTRIPVGLSWLRLHEYLTGEKEMNPWVGLVIGHLPILLVDLGLGSCYVSCTASCKGFCGNDRRKG
ncbi:uncharacterized protein B0H64DRAFT_121534 [Chaetomium fimeti]|uniref:Uncharacterized protein n=1 Tax=Chaetomium fimeti TaxID=1854472 RepID=A0AAE0HIR5_9PEZI|nr:hypothetical protein B0H64DRAFT_121534 [Chaetomium fimeti]